MRNLKRVLALAMAMVMILGMMVIGSSAASYADEAQIDATYEEAVDVLSGLEVMRGQGTGFAPKANIMRSEVAAIIYRIATKDVTDKQVGIYADYAKFNDVDAAAWYAGYVGYCANATYLKGYNGNVNPTGLVTGYQALAMILRVMGYDQNGEFEGEGWDIRTASTAQSLGILKNINTSTLGLPATREAVAEMVFQAMQCSKVSYTLAFGYQKTGVSLMDDFGAKKVAGVITDTTLDKGETTFAKGYTVVTESNTPWGKDTETEINVTVSKTDADWQKVGYAAYVWVTGLKSNTTDKTGTAKAITDIVITGETLSVTTDGTTIDAMTENKKLPSYVASKDSKVDQYVNGEEDTVVPAIGTKVALVDNDGNGKVDAIIAAEYTAAEVSNVLKISETGVVSDYSYTVLGLKDSKGNATILPEQLIGVDALAKGDVITYIAINDDDAANKTAIDYYYVTMAGVDTADFTAITWETIAGAKEQTYTIGGTEYVASERTNEKNYADLKAANLNETVDFTTDEYGYLLTAEVYSDPAAYLLVLDNEDSHGIKNIAETEVAYVDGTVTEIEVACGKTDVEDGELADGLTVDGVKKDGDIYTYKTNKAGYVELTDIADVHTVATYVDNSVEFNKVKVTNRTTFVDLRDVLKGKASAGTVYNGYLDLPGITDAEIVYTEKNGAMSLCFILDGTNTSDLTDSFVVFNTDINVQTAVKAGRDTVYTYTLKAGVITANELKENYELTEKQAAAIDTYGVGYYEFDVNGDLKKYTSFEADKVTWTPETNGTVVYNNIDITDDYGLHFLDISKGKYHSWGQYVVDGEYYAIVNAQKKIAYIVADATIVKGADDADWETILAASTDKGAVVYGDDADEKAYAGLIYTVADYKVTDVEKPVVVPTYTVTVTGHGVNEETDTYTGNVSAATFGYVLADHVKPGYEVIGYDVDGITTYTYDDVNGVVYLTGLNNNVVITIATDAIDYSITYKRNGGTLAAGNPTSYNADNKDAVLASIKDPTKAGYIFAGWKVTGADANGLGDLNFAAQWTADEFTVTFEYYDEAGKLIVSDTQQTTVMGGESKDVVLGKDAGYNYVVDNTVYAANAYYTISNITEDTVVEVTVVPFDEVVGAANTAELATALKDPKVDTIYLGEGEFTADLYNIDSKDSLTIIGNGDTKIAFNNLQVRASQFMELTIENCTIERMPDKKWGHLVFGSSTTAGGVYTISNCTFNGAGSQGIYINQDVAATFNIENCTFNGDFGSEGAITVQNNNGVAITVNVTDCAFNNIPATSHEIFVHYAYDGWTLNADGVDVYWKTK